jgi:hypothetical protein
MAVGTECSVLVLATCEKPATDILVSLDDMKFRSCMTLFDAVSKQEIFAEAIAAFYPDGKDRELGNSGNEPFPIAIVFRKPGTRLQLPRCFRRVHERMRIVAARNHGNHDRGR